MAFFTDSIVIFTEISLISFIIHSLPFDIISLVFDQSPLVIDDSISNPKFEHYYDLANFYKDNGYYKESIKYYSLTLKNLKEDPLGHLIFYFKKITSYIFINFRSHDPRYWNPLHFIPLLLFGITSLIGIILSDKKSRQLNYLILLFFVNVGIFSTFSIMPRYKLVILPLQIIFTNVLIKRIKEKFFNRGKNN